MPAFSEPVLYSVTNHTSNNTHQERQIRRETHSKKQNREYSNRREYTRIWTSQKGTKAKIQTKNTESYAKLTRAEKIEPIKEKKEISRRDKKNIRNSHSGCSLRRLFKDALSIVDETALIKYDVTNKISNKWLMNISKYFPDFHLKNKGNIITVGRLEPDTFRVGY
jgi:hypothetical protein